MAARKNIYLVLDTETADLTGSVYDVGYCIADRHGRIIREWSALVREVFTDAGRMMGAFYARKVFEHYAEALNRGSIAMWDWAEIKTQLNKDIADTGANIACAYNAGFDFRVMRTTNSMFSHDQFVLDHPMKMLDLWQLACETKLRQNEYIQMAIEHGWVTANGNIQTGAEFAYRYLTRNGEFRENHTALEDARIETVILAECLRLKKRIPYGILENSPWRIVANRRREIEAKQKRVCQ